MIERLLKWILQNLNRNLATYEVEQKYVYRQRVIAPSESGGPPVQIVTVISGDSLVIWSYTVVLN